MKYITIVLALLVPALVFAGDTSLVSWETSHTGKLQRVPLIRDSEIQHFISGMNPKQKASQLELPALQQLISAWTEQRLLSSWVKPNLTETERFRFISSSKRSAVRLMIHEKIDSVGGPEKISEQELAAFLKTESSLLARPEQRRASHILVNTRQEAQQLLEETKGLSIQKFKELANSRSIDPQTNMRGGDLGFFSQAPEEKDPDPKVETPLIQAAFSLTEQGEITKEPIQVGSSYSVLQLTATRPKEVPTLRTHKKVLAQRLWLQRRSQSLSSLEKKLRAKHKTVSMPKLSDKIQLPDRPLPGFPAPTEKPPKQK